MTKLYAANTDVSVSKTKTEIEQFLNKKGAIGFALFSNPNGAAISFMMNERWIRFKLTLPDPCQKRFFYGPRNKYTPRTKEQAEAKWEQECRSIWRALYLGIKAKMEIISSGITTFEEEFSPQTVMPNGQTLFEYAEPQLKLGYEKGIMPSSPMLPDLSKK